MRTKTFVSPRQWRRHIVLSVLALSMPCASFAQSSIPQWATEEITQLILQFTTQSITVSQATSSISDVLVRLATGWKSPLACAPGQGTTYGDNTVFLSRDEARGALLNGNMIFIPDTIYTKPSANVIDMQTGSHTEQKLWTEEESSSKWEVERIVVSDHTAYYRFQEKTVLRDYNCDMRTGDCSYEVLRTRPAKILHVDASKMPTSFHLVTLPEGMQYFTNMVWDEERNRLYGMAYGHKQPYRIVALDGESLAVRKEQQLPVLEHYDVSGKRGYDAQYLDIHELMLLPDGNTMVMLARQRLEYPYAIPKNIYGGYSTVLIDAQTLAIQKTYTSQDITTPLNNVPAEVVHSIGRTDVGRERRVREAFLEEIYRDSRYDDREVIYDAHHGVTLLRYGQKENMYLYRKQRDDLLTLNDATLQTIHHLSEDLSGGLTVEYIDTEAGIAFVRQNDDKLFAYDYLKGSTSPTTTLAMHEAMVRAVPPASAYVQTGIQKSPYNFMLDLLQYQKVNVCTE